MEKVDEVGAVELAKAVGALREVIAASRRLDVTAQRGGAAREGLSVETLALAYEVMALLPAAEEALRVGVQHLFCVAVNPGSTYRVAQAIGEERAAKVP